MRVLMSVLVALLGVGAAIGVAITYALLPSKTFKWTAREVVP